MDLSYITTMYVPIIIAACLVVGYVLKKWVKDVENKWIPTILAVLGAILAGITIDWTVGSLVAGAVSGLASTGLHQLFTQIIEGGKDN